MMKRVNENMGKKIISVILAVAVVVSAIGTPSYAAKKKNKDELVIVSLGDSYSSGEGIEPFFGQSDGLPEKLDNDDWLAHRSELAWPGLVKLQLDNNKAFDVDTVKSANSLKDLPGGKELKNEHENQKKDRTWFFAAVSGATTDNYTDWQRKEYCKDIVFLNVIIPYGSVVIPYGYDNYKDLPPQLNVFDDNKLKGKVDYVTMTIGGNDVDFAGIIKQCVLTSVHQNPRHLTDKLDSVWTKFENEWTRMAVDDQGNIVEKKEDCIKDKLKQAYRDVSEKAGNQATILVAGYPNLLDKKNNSILRGTPVGELYSEKKDWLAFNEAEADKLNTKVDEFNNEIQKIVEECKAEGIKIEFVPVKDKFDTHAAYSSDPYINPVKLVKVQDLKNLDFRLYKGIDVFKETLISSYSIHPNKAGAWAYAQCVYEKIQELEKNKPSNDTNKDTKKTSDTSNPNTEASANTDGPSYNGDPEELYKPILDSYYVMLDGGVSAVADIAEEPVVGNGAGEGIWDGTLSSVKYGFYDIDKNGIPELFIDGEYGVSSVYTYHDGKYIWLIGGGVRDEFTVYTDGTVIELGRGGAAFYVNSLYNYDMKSGGLIFQEAYILDAIYDSDNPYFYSTNENYEQQSSYIPITEDEFDACGGKLNSKTEIQYDKHPFKNYKYN